MYISVSPPNAAYMRQNQVSIGLDNGLSPIRRQAIIWTNAGILLIEPLGRKSSEILIKIKKFSFKKIHLKIPSAKWQPFPFCPGGGGVISHVTADVVHASAAQWRTYLHVISWSYSDRAPIKHSYVCNNQRTTGTRGKIAWNPICVRSCLL